MSDAKSQQEPSMEEILASIRKIISEDADGKPGEAPAAAAKPAPAAKPDFSMGMQDDVLDLTEKVNDDGSVTNLARDPEPTPMREPGPSFSFDEPPARKGGFDDDDDFARSLMSKDSANASANAFARLSELDDPEPEPPPAPVRSNGGGGLLVEDMVRDALAPVLKEWLDRNLPPIVEELVKAEIQRVAGNRRR